MSCCTHRQDGVATGGGSTVVLQGIIAAQVDAATAASGSTDTSVLLFELASIQVGAVTLADWVTRVDSATLGTTFTILQPGVYGVDAFMGLAAGVEVSMGVTLDASVAQRQGASTMVDPQMFDTDFSISGVISSLNPSADMAITQAQIDAGDNVIRVQAWVTTTGAVVPGASYINDEDVLVRIFRNGDVLG